MEEVAEDPEGGIGGWLREVHEECLSEDRKVLPSSGIEDWRDSWRLR